MPTTPKNTEQPFVVRRSAIQGRGGYATRAIKKGERIIEYTGERISWKEADKRYDDDVASGRHHTFLFTVNNRTIIDAKHEGNDARYINHSCDPNCEAIDEGARIFIFAMRAIAKGDELTYDYAYPRDKNTSEEDEKLYYCKCGAKKCRGTILEPPKKKVAKAHHAPARQPHEHRKVKGKKTGSSLGKATKPKKSTRGGSKPPAKAKRKTVRR